MVAGGSGQRMGAARPKQFLLLKGKSLLWHSLSAFLQAYGDMQIVLVLPAGNLDEGNQLAEELNATDRITVAAGGETRFHSVQNGLALVKEPAVVFVHDGVRCLVTPALIRKCYEQALEKGSAIPVVPATDSIRMIDGDNSKVIDRNLVRIIQTPQTFASEIILPAYNTGYNPAFTDEATVAEHAGHKVFLIDGEHTNIKITHPVDLLIGEKILDERR